MNKTVRRVNGTIIFSIILAAFDHLHLIKTLQQNSFFLKIYVDEAHLIHIPRAVGTIKEKRVPISSLKGMTSSSVVKKGPEKELCSRLT